VALGTHEVPYVATYSNWEEYVSGYPDVVPVKDPEAFIWRKKDKPVDPSLHLIPIQNPEPLTRNEVKAMQAERFKVAQGSEAGNSEVIGSRRATKLRNMTAQTEIKLGKDPIKNAAWELLSKRTWIQKSSYDRPEQAGVEYAATLKRQCQMEKEKAMSIKRQLDLAHESIGNMDGAVRRIQQELKEAHQKKRAAQRAQRIERSASQELVNHYSEWY
jgi:hypothetical protein